MHLLRRQVVISAENLGPIVSIVTIFLLILVILSIGTRFATKAIFRRKLGVEDALVLGALAFSIGQVIAVLVQESNGLGEPISSLTPQQITTFQRTAYASDLLYIPNLGLTRLSVLTLISSLTPVQTQKRLAVYLGLFVIAWTIITEFTFAFQCHTPNPWQFIDNECSNRNSIWIYFAITNTLSEAALIGLPMIVIWKLQVSKGKKIIILSSFALRLLVIVAIVAQAIYFIQASNTTDITLSSWTSVLCGQIAQSTNIITACFLHLKPFLQQLDSGLLRNDDRRHRRKKAGAHGPGSYYSSSNGEGYFKNASQRKASAAVNDGLGPPPAHQMNRPEHETSASSAPPKNGHTALVTAQEGIGSSAEDRRSLSSRAQMIHQTTTWAVEYDEEADPDEIQHVPEQSTAL
ncbi:hypothetical protein MMC11_005224 [Xylographa trunciseda]|nr:hypothetical protein [Xylographa trunciseda]